MDDVGEAPSVGESPSRQIEAAVVDTDIPVEVSAENGEETTDRWQEVAPAKAIVNPRTRQGFLHIYGWMGVPMLLIFILSALWTIMLAVIQHSPTEMANYVMSTQNLDNGDFWMLPKPDDSIAVPSIVLLVVISAGYLVLVALMLFPDKLMRKTYFGDHPSSVSLKQASVDEKILQSSRAWVVGDAVKLRAPGKEDCAKVRPRDHAASDIQNGANAVETSKARPSVLTLEWFRHEMTSPYGFLRHYYNPLLDLPKLIFQTSTLFTYLHNGFPIAVIFIYSCLLFINWLISCYRYKRERPDPHFILCRIFYSFDLFFAVFAPLEVLTYAYYSFKFDKADFATRAATLAPGLFDRTARLFANPRQVSLFRIAFHYLQFTEISTLFIKCALNALSLFKWWRTIVHLVEHARAIPIARESIIVGADGLERLRKLRRRQFYQNLATATVFFCAGAAVFIYSIVAVVSSNAVCGKYPQCKVPSYQWNVGADKCSCIVFVDRETAMKTYDEWLDPIDTTANLAALASTGHLRIVQIINRELPTLPDELRGCHHLEQLILIYTKTVVVPDWAKEFDHLEYLHIQGDFTPKRLTSLPRDLFEHMTHLMFVHLGCLINIPFVPDVTHLHRLEYLSLAMLHSVTEVPSLANLHNLRQLNFIDDIRLYTLPSVHHLTKLTTFTMTQRSPSCCNGFMGTPCDLTAFSCRNRTASGEPLVQCTDARYSAEDLAVADKTDGIVCDPNIASDLKDAEPTRFSTDGVCGGVMYKQCTMKNMIGMCYPARLQLITCQVRKMYLDMRRLQIEKGVGDPCDPTVEAWLGCRAK